MNKLHLEILTPTSKVLDLEVESVTVQGSEGRLGILPDHTPLIAQLSFGVLEYVNKLKAEKILCGAGFVEVSQNRVNVVVRSAESVSDIDIERAKRSKERAKSRLNSKEEDIDSHRAESSLSRANSRLDFGRS